MLNQDSVLEDAQLYSGVEPEESESPPLRPDPVIDNDNSTLDMFSIIAKILIVSA